MRTLRRTGVGFEPPVALPTVTIRTEYEGASPEVVYQLVADVTRWPVVFGPTVRVEHIERSPGHERFRIWAVVGEAVPDVGGGGRAVDVGHGRPVHVDPFVAEDGQVEVDHAHLDRDVGGAGEADDVDLGRSDQCLADFRAVLVHRVHDTGRQRWAVRQARHGHLVDQRRLRCRLLRRGRLRCRTGRRPTGSTATRWPISGQKWKTS